jgi:hypothetical protein
MAAPYYCPGCAILHSPPLHSVPEPERVTPARVVWESIAFLFIVLAIIYGGAAISFWLATRPQ